LNLEELQPPKLPVSFDEILAGIDIRVVRHVEQRLETRGLLPPKSLGAFVDRIAEFDQTVGPRLARYSERRAEALRRLQPRARENLDYQKATLGLALEITGISREDLLAWAPTDASQQSFLDGLPSAQVREDAMQHRHDRHQAHPASSCVRNGGR
jgi:hypothetical protein